MARKSQTNAQENISKLRDLIKGLDVAMFTTIEKDGQLHSRPMAVQQAEFDGSLWFFTRLHSPKSDELSQDGHVSVTFSSPKDNRYISIAGQAEVVNDKAKADELWNPIYKAWFPQGLDDPELALIKVDVARAEYWDSPSNTVVEMVGFVKALATGQPYEGGRNEKMQFFH